MYGGPGTDLPSEGAVRSQNHSTERPSGSAHPDGEPLLRATSLVVTAETLRTGGMSATEHAAQVYRWVQRVDRRIRAFQGGHQTRPRRAVAAHLRPHPRAGIY